MATPEQMAATKVANLEEKTGKTLAQWLKITRAAKLEKHGAIVKLLKAEHGVTHGFANLIAHHTLVSGGTKAPSEDPLAAQYAGKKAALRPIYERLIAVVEKFGGDVEIAPSRPMSACGARSSSRSSSPRRRPAWTWGSSSAARSLAPLARASVSSRRGASTPCARTACGSRSRPMWTRP